MKPNDLLKVAADYPLPYFPIVELEESDLNIEQLPQLLNYLSPEKIFWREYAKIIGPDGSSVTTSMSLRNDTEPIYVRTPIKKEQRGWDFKINSEVLVGLIRDLINCKEGESYFNPSPWTRKDWLEGKKVIMESGELTTIDGLKFREHELDKKTPPFSIDIPFYNPTYYYMNPFILNFDEKVDGKSNFFSVELHKAITFATASEIVLSKDNRSLRVEGSSEVIVTKSTTWKEAKPYELVWNLKVPIIHLDCKPPFNLSLYKLYPSGIVPFLFRYKNYELTLGLVNLNDEPVIANLILSARISSASILDGKGNEAEKIEPEFDRVKIPIRKNGIIYVKLTLRKLLESFLKRKIIS